MQEQKFQKTIIEFNFIKDILLELQKDKEQEERMELCSVVKQHFQDLLECGSLSGEQTEAINNCYQKLESFITEKTNCLKLIRIKNCLENYSKFYEDCNKPKEIVKPGNPPGNSSETDEDFTNPSEQIILIGKQVQDEDSLEDVDFQWNLNQKLIDISLKIKQEFNETQRCITEIKNKIVQDEQKQLQEDNEQCKKCLDLTKLEFNWAALQKQLQTGKGKDFILIFGCEDSDMFQVFQYLCHSEQKISLQEDVQNQQIFCSSVTAEQKIIVCFPPFIGDIREQCEYLDLINQRCLNEIKIISKSITPLLVLSCQKIFQDNHCEQYVRFLLKNLCNIFQSFEQYTENMSFVFTKNVKNCQRKQIYEYLEKIKNKFKENEEDLLKNFLHCIYYKTKIKHASVLIPNDNDHESMLEILKFTNTFTINNANWKEILLEEFSDSHQQKIQQFLAIQNKNTKNSENYLMLANHARDKVLLSDIFELQLINKSKEEQIEQAKQQLEQKIISFQRNLDSDLNKNGLISQAVLIKIDNGIRLLKTWEKYFQNSESKVLNYFQSINKSLEAIVLTRLKQSEIQFDEKAYLVSKIQQISLITDNYFDTQFQQATKYAEQHVISIFEKIVKKIDSLFKIENISAEEILDIQKTFNIQIKEISELMFELNNSEEITRQWLKNIEYFQQAQQYLQKCCQQCLSNNQAEIEKVIVNKDELASIKSKKMFLLLKGIRSFRKRLHFDNDTLIDIYLSQKQQFQDAWQKIYTILMNFLKQNKQKKEKKVIVSMAFQKKLWSQEFYIKELSQIKDLDTQLTINTNINFQQFKKKMEEVITIVGETALEELNTSTSQQHLKPNQHFLDNMTTLVQLKNWLDSTLTTDIVEQQYKIIIEKLIDYLNQQQNQIFAQFAQNSKNNTDQFIKKTDELFQKYYDFYQALDSNQINGKEMKLTYDIEETYLNFENQYIQLLLNNKGIIIKEEDIQSTKYQIDKVIKLYQGLMNKDNYPQKVINAYNQKFEETIDKICKQLIILEKKIMNEKTSATAEEHFEKYQTLLEGLKSLKKIRSINQFEELNSYVQGLKKNKTDNNKIQVDNFLDNKQFTNLDEFINKTSGHDQSNIIDYINKKIQDAYLIGEQSLESNKIIKSWNSTEFLQQLNTIKNKDVAIICSRLFDKLLQKLKAKIEEILQNYQQYCKNKIFEEGDTQCFFDVISVLANNLFQQEFRLQEKLKNIQEELYNKLNEFLNDFNINKDKLQNIDRTISKLNEMKVFINQLNQFQGEQNSLIQKLYDLKIHLPKFFEDRKQLEELVSKIEDKAKQQFSNGQYDQLAISLQISRNSQYCASFFNKSNSAHQKLVEYLESQIKKKIEETNRYLKEKKWENNKSLVVILDEIENLSQTLKDEPIISLICSHQKTVQEDIMNQVLIGYNYQFENAVRSYQSQKDQKFIDQIGECILNSAVIGQQLMQFNKLVEYFIGKSLNYFMENLKIEEFIKLTEYMTNNQRGRNKVTLSYELISDNANFKEARQKLLNDMIKQTHNINTVLDKLMYMEEEKNQYVIVQEEEYNMIKQNYNQYEIFKTQIIQLHLHQQNRVELLLQEFNELKKNFKQNENDLELKKQQIIQIITTVFTLWSFNGIDPKLQMLNDQNSEERMRYPHASQIVSVFIILGLNSASTVDDLLGIKKIQNNVALEVLTGEGKSLILAVAAIVLVIVKDIDIDVGCYSKYLTTRDQEVFQEIFVQLGVQDRIKYGTIDDLTNDMMNRDGDIRFLCQSLITNNEIPQIEVNQKQKGLLLDEFDMIASKDFYGDTYNPVKIVQIDEIIRIQEYIQQNNLQNSQTLKQTIKSLPVYIELIKKYPEWGELFQKHLDLMIQSVNQMDNYDEQYDIVENKIAYKTKDMTYNVDVIDGYLTVFAHFKEKDKQKIPPQEVNNVVGFHVVCGYFSYAKLLENYCFIKGVTGTLRSQHQDLRKLMKQFINKNYIAPSIFQDSKRIFDIERNVTVHEKKDDYHQRIFTQIDKYIKNEQAVLVFFDKNEQIEEFKTYLAQNKGVEKGKYLELNAKTKTSQINYIVKQSTRSGQVCLITRNFVRGTDFQVADPVVKNKGGVVVIQTFYSIDKTEEKQAQGRAARQNDPGEYFLVLLVTDLAKDLSLHEQTIAELIQSPLTMYTKLDQLREQIKQKEIIELEELKKKALLRHNESIILKQRLAQNQLKESKEKLLQIGLEDIESRLAIQIQPFHFLFVIDISDSMNQIDSGQTKSRFENVKDALVTFIKSRLQQTNGSIADKISLIIYNHQASIMFKFKELNLENIKIDIKPISTTYFYCGIEKVIELVKEDICGELQTIVIFLSDGGDMAKVQLFQQLEIVNNQLSNRITAWWNTGFGPGAQEGVLKDMADKLKDCNAQVTTILTAEGLRQYFIKLANISKKQIKA